MGMLAALILQAATPAAANAADLRCLAVVASGAIETPSRGGQAAGAMYFVGRIDARSPSFDYQAEMLKLIRSKADLGPDRARCSSLLKARGGALLALSNGLQTQLAK